MSFEVDIIIARDAMRITAAFAGGAGITALWGPSGAGKTSVLEAIAGLVRPVEGRIAVAGTLLYDSRQHLCLPPEQRACGYVFQDLRLFPHLTVRRNLLYGWKLAPPDRRWMSLDEACAFLGIGHLLDRHPETLSGGEAQRVALGRTLLSGPRFLLLDEPISSLDADRRDDILPVIERIRDALSLPILYVSHDSAEVARLAQTIIRMPEPSAARGAGP
jgi:molybdate transport system ATP-binding protein